VSRAPSQKNPGPLRRVVEAVLDGGWWFRLECGHTAVRDPRNLRPDAAERPPKRIACGTCGDAEVGRELAGASR
jgi:hypothetical protein